MTDEIRNAVPADIQPLAKIWHEGWHEVWEKLHARVLPDELKDRGTLAWFVKRLIADFEHIRTAGPPGAPNGFAITNGAELSQVYVSDSARRSGVGQALVLDAERRIAAQGADLVWLKCAIGNHPAIRLYERCGWTNGGQMTIELSGPTVAYPLVVWRFEKKLRTT